MWHPGAHLRMGVVIGAVAKWRAVLDGALIGVLLFRVPREHVPINGELIPRECIFLSFSLQSCLLSFIHTAFSHPDNSYCLRAVTFSSLVTFQFLAFANRLRHLVRALLGTFASPLLPSSFLFFLECVIWLVLRGYFGGKGLRSAAKWLL